MSATTASILAGNEAGACIPPFGEEIGAASLKFFLASITGHSWAPKVIAIHQNCQFYGSLLLKERLVVGIPCGLFYGDGTLGALVLARPEHRSTVLREGLRHLSEAPGFRGLRVTVPPDSANVSVIQAMHGSKGLQVSRREYVNHLVLPLPATYDELLSR